MPVQCTGYKTYKPTLRIFFRWIRVEPPVGNLLCYLHYFAMIYCTALNITVLQCIALQINILPGNVWNWTANH